MAPAEFEPLNLSVLVVEDELLIQMLLEEMLEDAGCSLAATCSTVAEALPTLRSLSFDVALVDLGLSDGSSETVIRDLAARSVPFAIMSGQAAHDFSGEADAYLAKPFTFENVYRALETLKLLHAERTTR